MTNSELIKALSKTTFSADELQQLRRAYNSAVERTRLASKDNFDVDDEVWFQHPKLGRIKGVVKNVLKVNIEVLASETKVLWRVSPNALKKVA